MKKAGKVISAAQLELVFSNTYRKPAGNAADRRKDRRRARREFFAKARGKGEVDG